MKQFGKFILISLLTLSLHSTISIDRVEAQCPMCRIAAESNMKHGGSEGKGLNVGILFMLSLPYLIVGSIGYVWWKNRKPMPENSEVNNSL